MANCMEHSLVYEDRHPHTLNGKWEEVIVELPSSVLLDGHSWAVHHFTEQFAT